MIADAPDIREYREERARGHRGLGLVLRDAERPEEAEEAFQASIGIREQLANQFPSVPLNRFSLAVGRQNLGRLYLDTGRDAEAKQQYSQAIDDLETLTDQFPADAGRRRELAELLRDCPIDELRDRDRAARLIEEVEKHDPNSADPEHTLQPGEVRPAGAGGSLSENDRKVKTRQKNNP